VIDQTFLTGLQPMLYYSNIAFVEVGDANVCCKYQTWS